MRSVRRDWSELEVTNGLIRVDVHLVSTKDGGRTRPVRSDYRPHWATGANYEGCPVRAGPRRDGELAPGEAALARIFPMFPEHWSHLTPGMTIDAYEGSRRVATATVLDVVPPMGQRQPTGPS